MLSLGRSRQTGGAAYRGLFQWMNQMTLDSKALSAVEGAAEQYMAAQGVLMSAVAKLGSTVDGTLNLLPEGIRSSLHDTLRSALDQAFKVAILNMDGETGKEASKGLYKLLGAATGAAGGFFGAPGILAELPVTTTAILRSIADVARSKGADLKDPAVQLACLQVFALGGPLDDDDEADALFVASRVGANIAAPKLAEMITKIASRFAITLSPKIVAQSVPIAGAVAGAGLNLTYMSFYQSMAAVMFTLKPIEAEFGQEATRQSFIDAINTVKAKKISGKTKIFP